MFQAPFGLLHGEAEFRLPDLSQKLALFDPVSEVGRDGCDLPVHFAGHSHLIVGFEGPYELDRALNLLIPHWDHRHCERGVSGILRLHFGRGTLAFAAGRQDQEQKQSPHSYILGFHLQNLAHHGSDSFLGPSTVML